MNIGLYEGQKPKEELKISFDSTFDNMGEFSDDEDENMEKEITFTPGLDQKAQEIAKSKEVLLFAKFRKTIRESNLLFLFFINSSNKSQHGINIWKRDKRNSKLSRLPKEQRPKKLKQKLLEVYIISILLLFQFLYSRIIIDISIQLLRRLIPNQIRRSQRQQRTNERRKS